MNYRYDINLHIAIKTVNEIINKEDSSFCSLLSFIPDDLKKKTDEQS